MPISKNQWLRLQFILGIMRKGEILNFNIFNEKAVKSMNFDRISPRTFTRDIHALKEIGAPVEYDASRKGFYLTAPAWTNEDVPTIPGDFKLLLLSERVSHSFMPPQLRGELSNAVNALFMKQGNTIPESMDLENFQIINPEFIPQVDPEVFLEVYQAWENKNYLRISYTSSKGHKSVKLIEPHILAWNSGIWYIKGLVAGENGSPCEPPLPIRVFALHRIEKAEKTMGSFTPDAEDIKRLKKTPLFIFEQLEEVEIEFFHPYVRQIQERFYSQPESIIAQSDDSITIRLRNIPEYAALQLIFLALGNVRVIKPAKLQESLRSAARTILDNMK